MQISKGTWRILPAAVVSFLYRPPAESGEPVRLQPAVEPGTSAVVQFQMQVRGNIRTSPAGKEGTPALKMSGEAQIEYEQQYVSVPDSNGQIAELRYYRLAQLQTIVADRRTASTLRQPVRLVIARERAARPFLYSPHGPLMPQELELIQGPYDPVALRRLLPQEPKTVGARWQPQSDAVAAALAIDSIEKNNLYATLLDADEKTALVYLGGSVEGTAQGASTIVRIVGELTFDRRSSSIVAASIKQREEREIGVAAPGFEVDAQFELRRLQGAETAQLSKLGPEAVPLKLSPEAEKLLYVQPQGTWRISLPRTWRVPYADQDSVVLKLVDGDLLAQCNIVTGPAALPGNHMKPDEFKKYVLEALARHSPKLLAEGELTGSNGLWIYRLELASTASSVPVLWRYYLLADPKGRQLILVFGLDARVADRFGQRDLDLVNSIQFGPQRTAAKPQE